MVKFYAFQVHEFFGDLVEIETYNVQDGSANHIRKADLYLVSTCAYGEYENVSEFLPLGGEIVVAQVTIHKESLHRLLAVPRNTRALLVNINPRMATETMAFLNRIGVNNIEFEPYYPGISHLPDARVAVTPGETRYVPPQIEEILDIGPRVLSPDTIIEIALKLHFDGMLEQEAFREYASSVVENNYSFQRLFNRSIQLESLFDILQGIVDLGVVGIDEEGIIFTFNKKAEYVTGLQREDALDRKASEVLPWIPFSECCADLREQRELLVKVRDVDISLSVKPIIRCGKPVGAFATMQKFTDEEYKQHKFRMQLMNKGHTTKYSFDDIIGESLPIRRACEVAHRMAASSAPVLITGESGTGKELFAHAIHEASVRHGYPFVAINCAAIPDNLLESELFGYEDGAFTGAKKGGKMGFFEFAHKGTLFLDEIEGMSPLLQLKLLRVIQEKEVLRVGGSRVISVDVRIITATNEDLMELVKNGGFRKDLYYRLGVLPIELPPLRDRGDDVLLLLEHLKQQVGTQFALSQAAQNILLAHRWDGNIRELRNCVEYLAYMQNQLVEPDDLPPGICCQQAADAPPPSIPMQETMLLLQQTAGSKLDTCLFLLARLASAAHEGHPTGRKSLAEEATRAGYFCSEQEVRTLLTRLEKLGLVAIYRGRGGSRITRLGESLISAFPVNG